MIIPVEARFVEGGSIRELEQEINNRMKHITRSTITGNHKLMDPSELMAVIGIN